MRSAAFAPDGKIVVGCDNDKTVYLWDAETGKEVHRLAGHEAPAFWAAFSPDAKKLASASSDFTVRLWDPGSGKEIARYKGKRAVAAWSPNSKLLAFPGTDHEILLVDADNGKT